MTPETTATNQPPAPCPRCSEAMRSATVKTAIWREDRLYVVEDIPAQVCDSCVEQFYDDETADTLRRLTAEGLLIPRSQARGPRPDLLTGRANPETDVLSRRGLG